MSEAQVEPEIEEAEPAIEPVEEPSKESTPSEPEVEVAPAQTWTDEQAEEAAKYGHKPKSDWKGDDAGWMPPDRFLDSSRVTRMKGEETRKELEEYKRERAASDARQTEIVQERVHNLERAHRAANMDRRADIEARYRAAEDEAFQLGDVARFQRLRVEKEQALAKLDKRAQEEAPRADPRVNQNGVTPEFQSEFDAFKAKDGNAAWLDHPALREEIAAAAQFAGKDPRYKDDTVKMMEEIKRRVTAARPDMAAVMGPVERPSSTNPAPRGPRVESGVSTTEPATRARGYVDLPADPKAAFKEFVDDGVYTDDSTGRAKYANAYWSQFDDE